VGLNLLLVMLLVVLLVYVVLLVFVVESRKWGIDCDFLFFTEYFDMPPLTTESDNVKLKGKVKH